MIRYRREFLLNNSVFGFPHYLSIFQIYLGRRIYIIFGLALIAGLADGFGILMLLPLLESLEEDSLLVGHKTDSSAVTELFLSLLRYFGLEESIVAILLIIAAAFLLKGVMLFAALGMNAYLRGRLLMELKSLLFDAYSRMNYGYYSSRDTGHFINVLNEQVNRALQSFHAITQLGSHLIGAFIYFGLAFLVAWRFGVMALVAGVILLFLFRWINTFVRDLSRRTATENGILSKLLIEILHGYKYLLATNQLSRLAPQVRSSISRLTSNEVRTGIASAFTQAAREPIAVTFIMLIVIMQLIVLGEPLTPILVSIVLFYRGMNSMMQIQGYWQNSMEFIGSMERVHDEFISQKENQERNGKRVAGPLSNGIKMSRVYFSYDSAVGNVIDGVDIEIRARTSTAFVGESGAGKSTLVDLITLMLKPQSGSITIDGLEGDSLELSNWRNQIGYVSQDAVVINDSIANNISFGNRFAESDTEHLAKIKAAARRAHLHEYITTLPEGYDTVIGDRGVNLSGGQRQRLAIARELFREPNILILDEATSSLDSESEHIIQRSIDELKGVTTVIVIAHRLSTVRNVDLIYVLDKGKVLEKGSYEKLRDTKGSKFERLASLQVL